MQFTTLSFLLFFLAVYCVYWTMKGRLPRQILLLLASVLFYGAWSPVFLVHFLLFLGVNHLAAVRLFHSRSRGLLTCVLLLNFANLFLFKYSYFFLSVLAGMLPDSGLGTQSVNGFLNATLGVGEITLPLAISFYTFQMTAFAVDTYRGQTPRPYNGLEYSLFIMFFPQLVAGPIVRHSELLGQISEVERLRPDSLDGGVFLLVQGLAKKLLVSDRLYPLVDQVFQSAERFDALTCAAGCLGFGALLYCDFSGYTDIARGLGRLLGFELPENFFAPYFSTSIRALWNNWHRTLTAWLRDYVYIPLGGQKLGFLRAQFNIVLTLTLCGIWHGAGWNFLFLGLYHGVLVALEAVFARVFGPAPKELPLWRRALGTLRVLVLLNVGFVLFRSPDLKHALSMYERILTGAGGERGPVELFVEMFAVALLFQGLQAKWAKEIPFARPWKRWTFLFVVGSLFVMLLGRYGGAGPAFYYFQF